MPKTDYPEWDDVKTSEQAEWYMEFWWAGDSGVSSTEIRDVLQAYKQMVLQEKEANIPNQEIICEDTGNFGGLHKSDKANR